jgi:hypothetical protein
MSENNQQDSESKAQYRISRTFSTNREDFPQTEAQSRGSETGFIEAAEVEDHLSGFESRSVEHRSRAPTGRYKHEAQSDQKQ